MRLQATLSYQAGARRAHSSLASGHGWDSGGGGCGIGLGEDLQDGALLMRALHMCVHVRMHVCVCDVYDGCVSRTWSSGIWPHISATFIFAVNVYNSKLSGQW